MSSGNENTVDYTHLGRSGLVVSNLCLGTMTFGKNEESYSAIYTSPTQTDEENSHKILDRFIQLGGNMIDTSNLYSHGKSEETIGQWLCRKNRSNIVLATKVRAPVGPGPNDSGLSRRHIIHSCHESLRRLQTNYIDLYQMHAWDDSVPLEETLRTFDDLIRGGKVRYIGASNLKGWQLQKMMDMSKYVGLPSVITLQQQYNLLRRESENDEFEVCNNEGVGVLPFGALKGGLLSGKYKKQNGNFAVTSGRLSHASSIGYKSTQSCPSLHSYENDDSYWKLMAAMTKMAESHGKTVSQIALRWVLQKNIVASVIIGATSIQQLEENMASGSGWRLSHDEMIELDTLSPRSNHFVQNQGDIWKSKARIMFPNTVVYSS
ncbi:1-deoxyxylulose-5-phosphate synthase YajO-like [Mytilus californianus]|uniref:1-deoxyxylulose-5-phosphate synthase YajO-like n=1 Tax=Mytilus californianus TaxID=6549 RepID=UPI00224631FE|nr:1-deoxyxylulose-5-phosphate synthase YajO-like [Mytilus californianus]